MQSSSYSSPSPSRPPLAAKTRSTSARTSSKKKEKSKSRVSVAERDYLEQDPPLRGQQYVCLSFISPEDEIQNKEAFTFHEFMKNFSNDVQSLFTNLQTKFDPSSPEALSTTDTESQSRSSEVNVMIEALKNRYDYLFNLKSLNEQYKHFKQLNNARLDNEYSEQNDFRTNVRGVKVRGVFDSLPEAKNRSAYLKKVDPKTPDIYVADMGCWIPWSPYPDDIQDQEYSETDLNTLMKKYRENADEKDEHFAQRKASLTQQMNKEQEEKMKKTKMVERIVEGENENEDDNVIEKPLENTPEKPLDDTLENTLKNTLKNTLENTLEQEDPWIEAKKNVYKTK